MATKWLQQEHRRLSHSVQERRAPSYLSFPRGTKPLKWIDMCVYVCIYNGGLLDWFTRYNPVWAVQQWLLSHQRGWMSTWHGRPVGFLIGSSVCIRKSKRLPLSAQNDGGIKMPTEEINLPTLHECEQAKKQRFSFLGLFFYLGF